LAWFHAPVDTSLGIPLVVSRRFAPRRLVLLFLTLLSFQGALPTQVFAPCPDVAAAAAAGWRINQDLPRDLGSTLQQTLRRWLE